MQEVESVKTLRKVFNSEKWFGAIYDIVLYNEVNDELQIYKNSIDNLEDELTELNHKPLLSVGATYEPYYDIESDYQLVTNTIKSLIDNSFPLIIITSQHLILKDLELLKELNKKSKVWVSFKIDHYDLTLLDAIEEFSHCGIKVGIIAKSSFIFESEEELLNRFLNDAKAKGVDFIIPAMVLSESYVNDDFKREYISNDYFYHQANFYDISTKMPFYDEQFMHTVQINLFE